MSESNPNDELLSAYLDDELSQEQRALVEQRLATDPKYAATLDAFRDQQMRLRALSGALPEGSIDVRQRVMEAVGKKTSLAPSANGAPSGWRLNRWVMASLAAMLLLGVFLFLPDFAKEQVAVHDAVLTADAPAAAEMSEDSPVAVEVVVPEGEGVVRLGGIERRVEGADLELRESDSLPVADSEPFFLGADGAQQFKTKNGIAMERKLAGQENLKTQSMRGRDLEEARLTKNANSPADANSPAGGLVGSAAQAMAPSKTMSPGSQNKSQARSASTGQWSATEEADSSKLPDPVDKPSVVRADSINGIDAGTVKRLAREKGSDESDSSRRFDGRLDRIWRVGPAGDLSAERLTLDRFRKALDLVGCDYQEEKPLRTFRQSAVRDETPENELANRKQEVRFVVTATPEQLVELRERVGKFALLQRFDQMVGTALVPGQQQWDGSQLPREADLAPADDGRTYRFVVYPQQESTVAP